MLDIPSYLVLVQIDLDVQQLPILESALKT